MTRLRQWLAVVLAVTLVHAVWWSATTVCPDRTTVTEACHESSAPADAPAPADCPLALHCASMVLVTAPVLPPIGAVPQPRAAHRAPTWADDIVHTLEPPPPKRA